MLSRLGPLFLSSCCFFFPSALLDVQMNIFRRIRLKRDTRNSDRIESDSSGVIFGSTRGAADIRRIIDVFPFIFHAYRRESTKLIKYVRKEQKAWASAFEVEDSAEGFPQEPEV